MKHAAGRKTLLFIESNTSGTGRLFAQTAVRLGYRPVLVSADPGRYSYLSEEPDLEVIPVRRIDVDELAHLVTRQFDSARELAGITSSSEYYIVAAAALARRFALPGPDPASVQACRDKSYQRVRLAAAQLPTPAFTVVSSPADAVRAACRHRWPVVLKPLDGSGSIGVRACANVFEVNAHAAALLESRERILVESLVTGPEFSVELHSGDVVGITRKHLGGEPYFVEAGHDFPAQLAPEDARILGDTATRATQLLGLDWGPVHCEIRLQRGRATVIEVNPRLAGGFIPELVRHATGIDLIRETLQLVTGCAPDLTVRHRRHASIRFLCASRPGRLASIDGLDRVTCLPHVIDVATYFRAGHELRLHGDFRDRVGHVIACADAHATACAVAEHARAGLRVIIESGSQDRLSSAASCQAATAG